MKIKATDKIYKNKMKQLAICFNLLLYTHRINKMKM